MKNSSFLGLLQSTDIPMNNPLSLNTPNSNSLFTQLYEKNSYDVRNCFVISVDQLGLEPRTSRL